MLHIYKAELNDSQLTWDDQPPRLMKHQRVLVIVEDLPPAREEMTPTPPYRLRDLAGRLAWKGDALKEQREQRDAW
ncbi:MAG: hypothetical protein AB1713_07745 [Pseudomonadota bacterium]